MVWRYDESIVHGRPPSFDEVRQNQSQATVQENGTEVYKRISGFNLILNTSIVIKKNLWYTVIHGQITCTFK